MSTVVKHGDHDQSDHGKWAQGRAANMAEAITRFGEEPVMRRKGKGDPDFDGKPSSRSVYATEQPDGSWKYDDDRAAFHETYYEKRLAEATPVGSPVVVFLGGGSGAGKDSLLKAGVFQVIANHVESNPDLAKEFLPEYQNGLAAEDATIAFAVHEESSMMSKEVQRRTMESGMNLVVNGTGDSSFEKVAKKVREMRDRGAQVVNGEYATISTEEAMRRAKERSENPNSPSYGRVVPEKFIREIHEGISTTVPKVLEARTYDEFRLWDNSLRNEPRLVLEQKGGRISVYDEGLYREFVMKSPEYAGGDFRIIDGIPVPVEVSKARILYDLTKFI